MTWTGGCVKAFIAAWRLSRIIRRLERREPFRDSIDNIQKNIDKMRTLERAITALDSP